MTFLSWLYFCQCVRSCGAHSDRVIPVRQMVHWQGRSMAQRAGKEKTIEDIRQLIVDAAGETMTQLVLSNPVDAKLVTRVKVRPILVKEQLQYQMSRFVGTKVFHENVTAEELADASSEYFRQQFRQLEMDTAAAHYTVLRSKSGTITVKRKQKPQSGDVAGTLPDLSHNRGKNYILREDEQIPFLVDLGVQTPDGKLIRAKYDKFRQINRFLEYIRDIIPSLPSGRRLTIIDFGCGKSYLTFAMYYYLHCKQGLDIHVIGLDLKEDVIRTCTDLSERYGYSGLEFRLGDIAMYNEVDRVDMVVTLHACDTATDYALYKAVKWGASVILSVPCCQHELNGQMKNVMLKPMLRYGLIRERMAALATDAIRADLLELHGYQTQILEFIDMEHTPKNILIRAVKDKSRRMRAGREGEELTAMIEQLSVSPTLLKLMKELEKSCEEESRSDNC